jgi:hypothetical protein
MPARRKDPFAVGARVDRRPQLLREARIVTVVPDLDDLAVPDAEDVDA